MISVVERYVAVEECLVVCREVLAMSETASLRVGACIPTGMVGANELLFIDTSAPGALIQGQRCDNTCAEPPSTVGDSLTAE